VTLIVGLGNPGESYSNNRHNIGFMAVDYLVSRLEASNVTKSSFLGDCFKSKDIILLKPTTYMNLSGKSVLSVCNFYKPEKIIVIHDDLDLHFGALKIKRGGGNGGHNGLKSIDEMCSSDYIRVRMGIGRPEDKSEVSSYVLSDFSDEQKKVLKRWIKYCADAVMELTKEEMKTVASKYCVKSIENVV